MHQNIKTLYRMDMTEVHRQFHGAGGREGVGEVVSHFSKFPLFYALWKRKLLQCLMTASHLITSHRDDHQKHKAGGGRTVANLNLQWLQLWPYNISFRINFQILLCLAYDLNYDASRWSSSTNWLQFKCSLRVKVCKICFGKFKNR